MSAPSKPSARPDFKTVEASRPAWDPESKLRYIQTADPSWTPGSGANKLHPSDPAPHVSIDPSDPERPSEFNYKLLVSAITPRPIALISSYNPDPRDPDNRDLDVGNLAPFSYFSLFNHDPPLFTVGFVSPPPPPPPPLTQGTVRRKKDTLANVAATRECVINIVSEDFLEAANSASVNAPRDVDEWTVSGLTKVFDCRDTPRCARAKEAVFSVECKARTIQEFESKREPGKTTSTLVVLEGVRFWVREDALNEERNAVSSAVLRPIGRLGGITYARATEVLELPRPDWEKDLGGREGLKMAEERMKEKGKQLPN